MDTAFDVAFRQIEALLLLMGVPRNIREVVRVLVAEHASPIRFQERLDQSAATLPLAQIARRFHKSSLSRNELLVSGMVQDGPWNMLLDLFAAGEEGRSVSVTSLGLASGLPATTALRAIGWLTEKGMIERSPDREDGRRTWMKITPQAREKMAHLIASFTVPAAPTIVLRSKD